MLNGSERPAPGMAGGIAVRAGLTHYLYPGALFADPRPHLVTTVLGSCVAVCLFDPVRRLGGINHYLLPLWNGEGLPTPRYGNVAIDLLIDRLLALGCVSSRLQAKVFGGAALWENPNGLLSVGERNVELAWRLLEQQRIPVTAADVGGEAGRKLLFTTATGEVLLRRNRSPQPARPMSAPA
jgi:chemotaxis protein CheD